MEEQTETSLLEEFVQAAERSNPAPKEATENEGAVAASTETENGTGEAKTAEAEAEAQDPNPEEADGSASQDEESANEDAGAPKPKFSNRKFKRYEHENRELKKRLAAVESYLAQQQRQAQAQQEEAAKPQKPSRKQFPSDEEYLDALSRWYAADAREQQEAFSRQQEEHNAKWANWANEYVEKLKENFKDDKDGLEEWKRLHSENEPMPAVLGKQLSDYIFSLEEAPKMQVYLWKHPNLTQKLVHAHPYMQAEMLQNIRAFVGRKTANSNANKSVAQNVVQPKPFGSARTGGAKADSVNLENASASQIFDMILASR